MHLRDGSVYQLGPRGPEFRVSVMTEAVQATASLPLGEVKVHSLQLNVNRRFSGGFTANAAMSFNSSQANRTVEEPGG